MSRIFIGIEGVGMRKSVAVAADESGRIVGAAMEPYGISLHAMPRDMLRSRLLRLIQGVAKQSGLDLNRLGDSTVCIGLTGVTFQYDATVDLPREFAAIGVHVRKLICTGDAEITFASHTQTSVGAAILSHMGSTAYVTKGPALRDRFRVGGWGPALGDEGSGYWIGRLALRAIGIEHDQREKPSILWKHIEDWLSAPDPEIPAWRQASAQWSQALRAFAENGCNDPRPAIFSFAHELSRESSATWREVASSLVHPIIKAAFAAKDETALDILAKAIESLANQFRQADSVADTQTLVMPLVLYGGVLTHHPELRRQLIEALKTIHGELTIVVPESGGTMRPACGALLFALGDAETQSLTLPPPKTIERLRADPALAASDGVLVND